MSTYLGEKASKKIESEEDLRHYFDVFAKRKEAIRVGIEAEFFGVDRKTGRALPYYGKQGIEEILKLLSLRFGYERIEEDSHVIALKRGDTYVTLEPGGQVELSAEPVLNVFEVEAQVNRFLDELRSIRNELGFLEWLAVGIHPFSEAEQIEWVPKKRYQIMADYLRQKGPLAHDMMKCTATNQVNFDYLDEQNAMDSLRVVLGISSIVSALFAHSSFSGGKPNGYATKRLYIWAHTDPDRTGLLLDFFDQGRSFKDYLEYLLELPMMFVVRDGKWLPVKKNNFRDFIQFGYAGTFATMADFELHLSTAFPEARLKQYLEIRGMDCQSPALIPAVAAFWKGILYDAEIRERAWNLVSFAGKEDQSRLWHEVPVKGLQSQLGNQAIFPIAQQLVELSCAGLGKQKLESKDRDECFFLSRIREKIVRPQKSPAEALLAVWNGAQQNPTRLIEYLSIG